MNPVETNGASNRAGVVPTMADIQMQSSLLAMAKGQADGASNGPPGLSTTPTLPGLVQALKRRWLLALSAAVVLTAATVAGVFFFHPPKYLVMLELRIVSRQTGPDDSEFPIFKASMETMVKNSIVLSNALNDKTEDGRDIKDLDIVRSHGLGAVGWLRKNLKTDYLLGPEVLRVTLAADEPKDAADLLNAISRAFLAEYAEMERAKKQIRLADLRAKKDALERDVQSLRAVRERLLDSLDVKEREALNVQLTQWDRKLTGAENTKRTIDESIARAKSEINTCNAKLKNIDKLQTPDEVLYEVYSRDQTLSDFQKHLAELDREISKYYQKYNEPFASQYAAPLKDDQKRITDRKTKREADLKPKIEAQWRKRVADDLKYRIEVAEERIQSDANLSAIEQKNIVEFDRRVRESTARTNKPGPIAATEEKIDLAQMALRNTAQKISDVELEPPVARVQPVQKAGVPLEKDKTQQTKIAGAGGLGVFLLALFGVGFYEFRSRKIGESDEIALGLGLNVVGTIPAMPTRSRKPTAKELLKEQQWLASLQESVDAIRTVILHQARTEAMHVIMITSAQSGEGKTTLATQLAASLARAWKRTLVIDGDMRHPGVHALFDTPQEPGLAEVLRGEVEPADAVRATPVSRLWVLPAGNGDPHAIQALAQENIRTLFEQLKQHYDFIIIDTPPVLAVTDSLLIGQHVDGVVHATLREVSRAPAVHAAQQKLAQLDVHTIGAVLLGAQTEFGDKTYAYAMNQVK